MLNEIQESELAGATCYRSWVHFTCMTCNQKGQQQVIRFLKIPYIFLHFLTSARARAMAGSKLNGSTTLPLRLSIFAHPPTPSYLVSLSTLDSPVFGYSPLFLDSLSLRLSLLLACLAGSANI